MVLIVVLTGAIGARLGAGLSRLTFASVIAAVRGVYFVKLGHGAVP